MATTTITRDATDRMLLRRLYLQRYATYLTRQVAAVSSRYDDELLGLLNNYLLEADEKSLSALSRYSTMSRSSWALVRGIKRLVKAQAAETLALIDAELSELLEVEARFAASVIAEELPVMRLEHRPVGAREASEIIQSMFAAYSVMLLARITQAASVEPLRIPRIVRGTKAERYRDGVIHWRDERLIRPELNRLVNATATSAHVQVFDEFQIKTVTWLATLDYRTCPRCYTAEVNSPYPIGKVPPCPLHVNCRCILIPGTPGVTTERPFVADKRAVSGIPKRERAGKVGRTRDTITEFFNRMSDKDRADYMGPKRWAKWQAGTISDIKQLVDEVTLSPLTLAEIG